MVKKMNKRGFIKELIKETKLPEEKCIIINDCMEEYFIIGRTNKEKTISLLMEKLNYDYEKADEIYNIASKIISTSIKDKIIHPFKSQD